MAGIAFLGLGRMGARMGTRLLDAGHDLTVWNRSKEKAEPLAERGARVAGTLGAGASLKLVVNSTLGAVMVAVGEALALARALGVDERAAVETLEGSYVGGVVRSKRHLIDGREGETNFALRLAAKDMRLVTEAAERAGVRLRAGHANQLTFGEASGEGLSDADYGAVIPFLRDRAE